MWLPHTSFGQDQTGSLYRRLKETSANAALQDLNATAEKEMLLESI